MEPENPSWKRRNIYKPFFWGSVLVSRSVEFTNKMLNYHDIDIPYIPPKIAVFGLIRFLSIPY